MRPVLNHELKYRNTKPELLAPGGSLEKCRIAYMYGADAVYVGGKEWGLRAYARNLNREELAAASCLAHTMGKKLFVTVNIFPSELDLKALPAYLEYLSDIRVDGIIVSDPGVIALTRQYCPSLPIHLSTQANTTNSSSVAFWQQQGVRRINLAREISFEDLCEIRRSATSELEIFVHGAMCVSYSGRCLMSAFMTERSANRGQCTQPCRWSYALVEQKRPGQYFPVLEDPRGTYIFNSKDLCLMGELGKLMAVRVDAFKIEGRMKGALYLAGVVRSYRQAIDRYWDCPDRFQVEREWLMDLEQTSHRPYTKGLLFQDSDYKDGQVAVSTGYLQSHTLAGLVRPNPHQRWDIPVLPESVEKGRIYVEARSRLTHGVTLEFLYPDGRTVPYRLEYFEDLRGNPLSVAHPNSWVTLSVPFDVFPLQVIRMAQGKAKCSTAMEH